MNIPFGTFGQVDGDLGIAFKICAIRGTSRCAAAKLVARPDVAVAEAVFLADQLALTR